jgi:hypothetical protein
MTSIEQRILDTVATCTGNSVWQRCAEPGYPYVVADVPQTIRVYANRHDGYVIILDTDDDGCFSTTEDFTGTSRQSITTAIRHGRERLDAVRTRRAFYRDERRVLSSVAAALAHQGLQTTRTAEGLQVGELSVSCIEELTQDGAPTGRALWLVTGAGIVATAEKDGTCPQDAATLIARVAGLEPTLSH